MCVSGFAPSGRSASLMAFMTAPGAPAVPASPAPLAPSSESAVGGAPGAAARAVGSYAHIARAPATAHCDGVEPAPGRRGVAVLEPRPADPLHHAAANLLVDELRVDDRAAVLHAPVLEQLYDPGVGVDFEVARLHAVGEGERPG